MIILGKRYKFTKLEKARLRKKNSQAIIMQHENINPNKIIEKIDKIFKETNNSMIILNTKTAINDTIVKYLTSIRLNNKKINIITIEHFLEKYLNKCYVPDNYINIDYLSNIKQFNLWQYIQKRIVDYIGVFILFFLTWPIFFYAMYKIKKESFGNIIFKQTRVRENGKLFICNKFRSMHENSYHDPYTKENDNRIFAWGKIMRKTRIDELPQILNVLKGEMHLIGPRAEWNILVENYEKEIPYYNERHIVKPGITGWAQVMYPYGGNVKDAKQKLMYDFYYIKNWNIFLEIKVIFKTIKVIMSKKGI